MQSIVNAYYKENKSISEICENNKISKSKFIRLRNLYKNQGNTSNSLSQVVQPRSILKDEEILFIRCLALDPYHCYTGKEIKNALLAKFNVDVSVSTIYYRMHHSLKLSFKKFLPEPPEYFFHNQKFSRFKASLDLLLNINSNVRIISCDESGFDVSLYHSRCWGSVGKMCYKAVKPVLKRYNLLLAVDKNGVVGFIIRQGNFESKSFCDFIIKLSKKLLLKDPSNYQNIIFYMDNATFHRGQISTQLQKILNIKFVFNAPRFSCLNITEFYFAYIKGQMRKHTIGSEYFKYSIKK